MHTHNRWIGIGVLVLGLVCVGCGVQAPSDRGDSEVVSCEDGAPWACLRSALVAERRESVYCAWSYLNRQDLEGIPERTAESREEWIAYGPELSEWLDQQDQETVDRLIAGYPAFVETWSPYYMD